ncbi:MAG: LpxI family protein [Alphaproteobacteria bacterium]|nr:LpxI family protein [Alphaproteobacteria bacterium]
MTAGRLGIICGAGALPAIVALQCQDRGSMPFVLGLQGSAEAALFAVPPDAWVGPGQPGRAFALLHAAGVSELIFLGAVKRIAFSGISLDWRAAMFLARVAIRSLGDDTILRAVAAEVEAEGFRIVGVKDVAPACMAPVGALGRVSLPSDCSDLIAKGVEAARSLGRADRGQAVVVGHEGVVAVEDEAGTDALIAQCGSHTGRKILVKCRKPQQDDRFDLPAIGAGTVSASARAGLAGLAVEAGETIIIDHAATRAAADAAGLFVHGIAGEGA